MPNTLVHSRWKNGSLVFHDADDLGVGAEIFQISPATIYIGTSTNDVTLTMYGDVSLYGDLDLADEDISVAVGKYIYLDGSTGNDYLRAATDNNVILNGQSTVSLGIAGTAELKLTATVLSPNTSGGLALGSGTLMWDDLFLTDTSVINFNNGNVTLTHAAGKLLLNSTTKLEFRSTSHYIQSDATNDLMVNAGTTLNLAVAGTDEVAISATAVTLASNNLTLTTGNISVAADKKIYLRGQASGEYIYSTSAGKIRIYSSDTSNNAIALAPAAGGGISLDGYAKLLSTDSDGDTDAQLWYDNSEDKLKYYGGAVRTVASLEQVGIFTAHQNFNAGAKMGSDQHLTFRDPQVYICSMGDARLGLYSDGTDYRAISLTTGSGGGVVFGAYVGLLVTDADASVEGQLWMDNSEDKVKYYGGGGVKTLASLEQAGTFTANQNFNAGARINTTQRLSFRDPQIYINSQGDGRLGFYSDGTSYRAIGFTTGNGGGIELSNCFLGLFVTASIGATEGQIWYDSGSNKIHFWNGTAEQEVTSGGA